MTPRPGELQPAALSHADASPLTAKGCLLTLQRLLRRFQFEQAVCSGSRFMPQPKPCRTPHPATAAAAAAAPTMSAAIPHSAGTVPWLCFHHLLCASSPPCSGGAHAVGRSLLGIDRRLISPPAPLPAAAAPPQSPAAASSWRALHAGTGTSHVLVLHAEEEDEKVTTKKISMTSRVLMYSF